MGGGDSGRGIGFLGVTPNKLVTFPSLALSPAYILLLPYAVVATCRLHKEISATLRW